MRLTDAPTRYIAKCKCGTHTSALIEVSEHVAADTASGHRKYPTPTGSFRVRRVHSEFTAGRRVSCVVDVDLFGTRSRYVGSSARSTSVATVVCRQLVTTANVHAPGRITARVMDEGKMKTRWWVWVNVLLACGGSDATTAVEAPSHVDGSTADGGDQTQAAVDSDAGSGTGVDSGNSTIDAGDPVYDACKASVCASHACGAKGTCNGKPVDCGECSYAADRCGDLQPNQCGHVCAAGAINICNNGSATPAATFQSTWEFDPACTNAPYRFGDGVNVGDRTLHVRADGLSGCVRRTFNGAMAMCCP